MFYRPFGSLKSEALLGDDGGLVYNSGLIVEILRGAVNWGAGGGLPVDSPIRLAFV